jgi:hypothetical protein
MPKTMSRWRMAVRSLGSPSGAAELPPLRQPMPPIGRVPLRSDARRPGSATESSYQCAAGRRRGEDSLGQPSLRPRRRPGQPTVRVLEQRRSERDKERWNAHSSTEIKRGRGDVGELQRQVRRCTTERRCMLSGRSGGRCVYWSWSVDGLQLSPTGCAARAPLTAVPAEGQSRQPRHNATAALPASACFLPLPPPTSCRAAPPRPLERWPPPGRGERSTSPSSSSSSRPSPCTAVLPSSSAAPAPLAVRRRGEEEEEEEGLARGPSSSPPPLLLLLLLSTA